MDSLKAGMIAYIHTVCTGMQHLLLLLVLPMMLQLKLLSSQHNVPAALSEGLPQRRSVRGLATRISLVQTATGAMQEPPPYSADATATGKHFKSFSVVVAFRLP